ncbi:hypothetical protein O181_091852 [Austropuccinia psidii MF-1]|uniref:Uncharacterized protein n=1 Tax=Austropuccinia psidii MF-1 TaxID=1389203 RepID=A0A9Q3IYC3_9BASI|nr:hypothetical protein [Austropuccinia psidii MF-1]
MLLAHVATIRVMQLCHHTHNSSIPAKPSARDFKATTATYTRTFKAKFQRGPTLLKKESNIKCTNEWGWRLLPSDDGEVWVSCTAQGNVPYSCKKKKCGAPKRNADKTAVPNNPLVLKSCSPSFGEGYSDISNPDMYQAFDRCKKLWVVPNRNARITSFKCPWKGQDDVNNKRIICGECRKAAYKPMVFTGDCSAV